MVIVTINRVWWRSGMFQCGMVSNGYSFLFPPLYSSCAVIYIMLICSPNGWEALVYSRCANGDCCLIGQKVKHIPHPSRYKYDV
jgi:hypothetical protein